MFLEWHLYFEVESDVLFSIEKNKKDKLQSEFTAILKSNVKTLEAPCF